MDRKASNIMTGAGKAYIKLIEKSGYYCYYCYLHYLV